MLDEVSITLLSKVFVESTSSQGGVNSQKFRAENYTHLEQIDLLVSAGYIENRDGKYSLRLATLSEIADKTPQVGSLLYLCGHLFDVLHQAYLNAPGESVSLNKLAELADLPRQKLYAAIPYLFEASVICSFSTEFLENDAYVTPAEKLLRHSSFQSVVDEMNSWINKTQTSQSVVKKWGRTNHPSDVEMIFEHLLHPLIVEHALPKYKDGHLRNAVMDSVIAVYDLIRKRTGLSEDGDKLIGKVFSLDKPYLVLSELETDSGKNDQKGFIQIVNGAYLGVRNPTAHSLKHDLTSTQAAQYLVLASLLAQRVDEAEVISR